MVSILEYSLHFATVLSRWAREYTNEVGALEVLQKIYSLSPKPLSFFRREPTPQGKGRAEKMHITCRKNAHHRGALEVLQKIYSLPQNPYTNPLEIT